jgi:hypothetical protein
MPMSKVGRLDMISSGMRRRWTLQEKQRIVAGELRGIAAVVSDSAPERPFWEPAVYVAAPGPGWTAGGSIERRPPREVGTCHVIPGANIERHFRFMKPAYQGCD